MNDKSQTTPRWRETIDQFVNTPDPDAYEQEDLRIAVEFALSPAGRLRREEREVALALEIVRLRRWLEWIAADDSDAEAALRGDRFWRLDDQPLRQVLAGELGGDAAFRLIVEGMYGPREIGYLIRQLEVMREAIR